MKTARCSALPLLEACPQAGAFTDTPIGSPREAADAGSAAHQVLTAWIRAGRPQESAEDLAVAATQWSVDADELSSLVWRGWKLWRQVAEHFPDPLTEVELERIDSENGITLTGHADVLSVVDDEVRILDLKTGRRDDDHWSQLRGYCWLASCEVRWPLAHETYGAVLRVRDGVIDGRRFTGAELSAWYGGLLRRLRETEYRPGRHCSHCPRAASCPAVLDTLSQAVQVLAGGGEVTGESVALTYDALKHIGKWADQARDALKAFVAANGPQDLGDGRRLEIVPLEQKRIHYPTAAPILVRYLGADTLVELTKVGKTDVENAVKDKAPRGHKGAAVDELLCVLQNAGALIPHVVERLEECRRVGDTPALTTEKR
jgi:RecB family exonuclease